MAVKVAFLLERFRRRRGKDGSSPSLRQIALVVVSAGLAILVIRVASQRIRSRGAGAQAGTQGGADAQAETQGGADAQAETQSGAGEAPSTAWTSANEAGLANESSFTDAVQNQLSRRDDAPTRSAGAE